MIITPTITVRHRDQYTINEFTIFNIRAISTVKKRQIPVTVSSGEVVVQPTAPQRRGHHGLLRMSDPEQP